MLLFLFIIMDDIAVTAIIANLLLVMDFSVFRGVLKELA